MALECAPIQYTRHVPSVNHNMINLVERWSIGRHPSVLVNVEMLKLVLYATKLRAAAISISLLLSTKVLFAWRLNCPIVGPKTPSRPTFALKSPRTILALSDGPLYIRPLSSAEDIFNHIALFFRWGVSTNKANVVEFCSDVNCGYSFVHRREPRQGDEIAY